MKILHIYKNEPAEDTRKLVEILSEGREAESFNLYEGDPDYDKLIEMMIAADQSVCWW